MSQYADPPNAAQPPADQAFDLRTYWRVVKRRRWVVLGVFVATVVAIAAHTLREPKIYAAICTIVIDSAPKVFDSQQVQDVADPGPAAYWFSKEYYETQYKVLQSRAVAVRVV